MKSESLIEVAQTLPGWEVYPLHEFGSRTLRLVNATVSTHDFDKHDTPETLICLQGPYAIETPSGLVDIPEGHSFTVPPGLEHRPANRETCVILVAR
jgi:mannose-6-phosphate isomerase-like protein (cupin superfamily)